MLDTIRVYFDATLAVGFMVTFGAISGLVAAGLTDDRTVVLGTIAAVFTLTGIALLLRLWFITHKPMAPRGPMAND